MSGQRRQNKMKHWWDNDIDRADAALRKASKERMSETSPSGRHSKSNEMKHHFEMGRDLRERRRKDQERVRKQKDSKGL